MARTPDPQLKRELLDRVVSYLADQGLAQTTLRPMAADLGVSINRLMHHFGSKDELITAALARAIDQQIEVQRKWLQRSPKLTQVELYRRWWKWLCASPQNLALVRLNYEARTCCTAGVADQGDVHRVGDGSVCHWRYTSSHEGTRVVARPTQRRSVRQRRRQRGFLTSTSPSKCCRPARAWCCEATLPCNGGAEPRAERTNRAAPIGHVAFRA